MDQSSSNLSFREQCKLKSVDFSHTPEEREVYADASKGIYYCAYIGKVSAVKLYAENDYRNKNYIDVAMIAAAYNHLELIQWLVENRKEIITALGWIAVVAFRYKSEDTLNFLSLRCDLKRRYLYYGSLSYRKVELKRTSTFCIIDSIKRKFEVSEDLRTAAIEIMCRILERLNITEPFLH